MADMFQIIAAVLAGFFTAIMFSSMPGPLNLTILNEGAQRGFKHGALIGLGASVMESLYCAIAFTGFTSFFEIRMVKATMEVFSFVFFLFLGAKFLMTPTMTVLPRLDAASEKIGARIDQRLHPESAFMTGFLRVMGNLGVLLGWIVAAAYSMAHDRVENVLWAKAACVTGVLLGCNTWFCSFSYGVSKGQGRFSEKTLLRLQHLSGLCLMAAGIFGGAHIIWQLAKHKNF
jgi:threonine/homoserine/homoserine lactone efflux protein